MRTLPLPIYILALAGFCLSMLIIFHAIPPSWPHVDFMNFWAAPKLALSDPSLLIDLDRYHAAQEALLGYPYDTLNIWSYPPHALPLLLPLSLFPAVTAQLIWLALGFLAYAYVVREGFAPAYRWTGILLLLISPAAIMNVGQNAFFTAALFLGAVACLDKRPILAGILLGLLTIKPQFGFVWPLALLALGCWRTIITAVITTLLLTLLSIAVYGPEVWQGFFSFTMPRQWEFIVEPFLPRIYQLVLLSFPNAAQASGFSVTSGLYIQWVVSAVVVLGCALGMRRTRDLHTRALLMSSGAALASPYIMNYDLTAVSAVLLWILLRQGSKPSRLTFCIFASAYLLPVLAPFLNLFHVPLSPLILTALYAVALRSALTALH